MVDKIIELVKDKEVHFPKLLLSNYKKMDLTEQELVLAIYLLNEKLSDFNPKKIANDISWEVNDVLETINNLTTKDLITIEIKKINNVMNEFISVENLYKKLSYYIVTHEEKETVSNNIFDVFEREFGRTLSPMEYEIVNGWLKDKMDEEMVVLALKEATYNGVSNLRYIDKIIYEWRKKGLTSKELIETRNDNKKEVKQLFDYNWLDEE